MKHNQYTVSIRFNFAEPVSEEQLAAALIRSCKTRAFGINGSFIIQSCEGGVRVNVAPSQGLPGASGPVIQPGPARSTDPPIPPAPDGMIVERRVYDLIEEE